VRPKEAKMTNRAASEIAPPLDNDLSARSLVLLWVLCLPRDNLAGGRAARTNLQSLIANFGSAALGCAISSHALRMAHRSRAARSALHRGLRKRGRLGANAMVAVGAFWLLF
jgi:hypothetical protein